MIADTPTSPATPGTQDEPNLTVGRNIKIGFFHLGSGMADVLATGVWNRIMISDLGFAATPVGLLVSLRYFLAPLGIWSGRISDERTILGFRRLFWIWLGRLMMMLSVFSLGMTTAAIARGIEVTTWVWLALIVSLLLFSLGNAISGSTFLALIYDRSADHQRGRAVGIVWTFLLLGFTVAGITFGVMFPSAETRDLFRFTDPVISNMVYYDTLLMQGVPSFTPEALESLFIVAGLIMGSLWFFSLLGEEKRARADYATETGKQKSEVDTSVWQDLGLVWRSRPLRFFGFYLGLSMLFAFSQDLVLEPMAADVFDMSPAVTTRFAAYWGSMSILGTLAFLWLSRRYKWLDNTRMSYMGVSILIVTFVLFGLSASLEIRDLVRPGLILLGLGLGIWNVGTLGLMMDMSPLERAGTFLGFWTLLVTFARGFGVSGGGIIRDIALNLSGDLNFSYAIVFYIGAVGLGVSAWALMGARARENRIARSTKKDTEQVFAGAMD